MDAKLFRLPTKPNFYAAVATSAPFDSEQRQKYSTLPTPDSRFPGWSAPMADGRLVTDYQPHCARNIPSGRQYATKEWMTKHAEEIIAVGRDRFVQQTGAFYGVDASIVPPPAIVVKMSASEVQRFQTGRMGGLGIERAGADAPELFGTWDPRDGSVAPAPRIQLTSRYEGGRNTPRGGDSELR